MTAADLAHGRALREAERTERFQSRVTSALNDWLDAHVDELLDAAAALADRDAQIATLQVELAFHEIATACEPVQPVEQKPPLEPYHRSKEFDHILSGDYYVPGHKDDV